MLDKIKETVEKKKLQSQAKKLEEALNEARIQQINEENKKNSLKEETRKLAEEKERLLHLDNKALMVELIFSIRGFYAKVGELETGQEYLSGRINSLESEIRSLESEIDSVRSKINSMAQ